LDVSHFVIADEEAFADEELLLMKSLLLFNSSSRFKSSWLHGFSLLVAIASVICFNCAVHATTITNPADESAIKEIRVGFGGIYRLGFWTPVQIELDDSIATECHTVEVSTIDGEGSNVSYRETDIKLRNSTVHTLVRIGRQSAFLNIRLLDDAGELVAEKRLTPSEFSKVARSVQSTEPIDIIIGDPQLATSMLKINLTENKGAAAGYTPGRLNLLPIDALSYEGVDRIVLTTKDNRILESLSAQQLQAIKQWLHNGGHLVVSAGANGQSLFSDGGAIADISSARIDGTEQIVNTAALEHFANPSSRLVSEQSQSLVVSRMVAFSGRKILESSDRILIGTEAVGFGQLTLFLFDLDDELILRWDGSARMFRKSQNFEKAQSAPEVKVRSTAVSHDGFNDMTGQLRLALDKFSEVSFVSFALVALLISLYILMIGPGDYFLLKRWLGKMHFTWITFPVITLIFCGLSWFVVQTTKPQKIIMNQLDIIDVDLTDGSVRGSTWTHVYTPNAIDLNVAIQTTQFPAAVNDRVVTWQGLPGNGLGGMQNSQIIGINNSSYQQTINRSAERVLIQIKDLTANVAATRSLFSQWHGELQQPIRADFKDMRQMGSINALRGTFVNPLDVPLQQCVVFFGDWAYAISDPIEPGQSIDLQSEADERTSRGYLTRRTGGGDFDETVTPWNTTSTNLDRIVEMLSMFDAAGGESYTTLTHDYQDFSDLSNHLRLNRAVLIGVVPKATTQLRLQKQSTEDGSESGNDLEYQFDNQRTIVRIIIPVESAER
jgi:hypothetical protein